MARTKAAAWGRGTARHGMGSGLAFCPTLRVARRPTDLPPRVELAPLHRTEVNP